MRVALAGPMAVGKSTVGRALAERIGEEFVDLDAEIGDIPDLFAHVGEVGFRALERACLARRVEGQGVMALGGGTLQAEGNRTLLSGWRVVVLMASAATLRARIGNGDARPLAQQMDALLVERTPVWQTFAPWIHTDGRTVEAVVDELVLLCQ